MLWCPATKTTCSISPNKCHCTATTSYKSKKDCNFYSFGAVILFLCDPQQALQRTSVTTEALKHSRSVLLHSSSPCQRGNMHETEDSLSCSSSSTALQTIAINQFSRTDTLVLQGYHVDTDACVCRLRSKPDPWHGEIRSTFFSVRLIESSPETSLCVIELRYHKKEEMNRAEKNHCVN